jgi:HAE1 family hydrophobic/amphiphilic exporter-1
MSFAIMVSLLVSFTLTPMLSARWIKAKKDVHEKTFEGHALLQADRRRLQRLLGVVARATAALVAAWARCWSYSAALPIFMATANKNFLPQRRQVGDSRSVCGAPGWHEHRATEIIAERTATRVRRCPKVDYNARDDSPDDPAQTQNSGTSTCR